MKAIFAAIFVAFPLLSVPTDARLSAANPEGGHEALRPNVHLRHGHDHKRSKGMNHGPAALPDKGVILDGPGGELRARAGIIVEEEVVVVITRVVKPMPIGTYDGIYYSGAPTGTGTGSPSGVFPSCSSGNGGTGIPSGIFPPDSPGTGINPLPVPTGYPVKSSIPLITNSTVIWPVFTGKPKIIIPSNGSPGSGLPPTTRLSSALSSVPLATGSSIEFPDFTDAPKISIPGASGQPVSRSSSSTLPSSVITTSIAFPDFTDAPKISIPGVSSSKSTSLTPSSTSEALVPSSVSKAIPFLRGVNLGGWLVLEKWMTEDLFTGAFSSAADQYSFDSLPGSLSALEKHWSTFFTAEDISTIAATGINALRIPIGYWAYDNSGTPYHKGADAYLEKAIEWARAEGLKVWVDCHGSPGGQNGFDNSGHSGIVSWQTTSNLDKSIEVLKIMAAKYGSTSYADVVVGLQMVNEPVSWGNNDFDTTKEWTKKAYTAIEGVVENKELIVVMHDGFMGGLEWKDVAIELADGAEKKTFGIDEHLYQLFTPAYNGMNQAQHITAACGWAADLAASNAITPTYVGEWSAATNICVNPDGSTTAGTSCSTEGCQCQLEDFAKWNDKMIEQVRRFVEAQLDVFESSTSGYFGWSAKGPGGWGFLNGIEKGIIPNPVTTRKYSSQCGGGPKKRGNRNLRRA